jgi:predicted double-glycine peptidase
MIKVKIYRQSRSYCGPASLRILLTRYDRFLTESYLARLAKCTRRKGTTGENIVEAAKRLGFYAYMKDNAKIDDVKRYVKQGFPVIVDWFSPMGGGHYSVVIGFEKNRLYLADPYLGRKRIVKIKDFMEVWFDFYGDIPDKRTDFIIRRMIIVLPK